MYGPHKVYLYIPQQKHKPRPYPSPSGGQSQPQLARTGEDPHHLRSYRQGDPPRAVAWKASARRDTLLVREYEFALRRRVDIGLAAHSKACRMNSASAAWHAGWTMPNAPGNAMPCICRQHPGLILGMGHSIATCACVHSRVPDEARHG